jgi:phage-related baseplate assembly protein
MTTPIDLSQIPAPNVVEALDFDSIFNDMRDQLIALDPSLAEALSLESEPMVKQLQLSAYRELLLRQRVNEAARANMLAYAMESDLENLGALLGVGRLVTDPGDPDATPPIDPTYEGDEEYRLRIQLSLNGLSTAGPERAYVYHALSADGRVLDATADAPRFSRAAVDPSIMSQLPPNSIVLQVDYDAGLPEPMPGDVVINVLSRLGNGTPAADLVEAVNAALSAEDIRPLTDHVHTRGASIKEYAVEAELFTFPGPDTTVVLNTAEENANAYVEESKRLGRSVTLSGLYAALHVSGVQRVNIISPAADVECTDAEAAHCTGISLTHGGLAS